MQILQDQWTLCEKIYNLLLEENQILKQGNDLSENFIEQKKDLLTKLYAAVEAIRTLKKNTISPQEQDLLIKIQNKLMQILLQGRENEQLLAKANFVSHLQTPSINAQAIEKIYRND